MAKQLNIRSDEAYETAQRLASHLNKSATAVVETALKEYAKSVLPEVPPEEAAETSRILTELGREISNHVRPGRPPIIATFTMIRACRFDRAGAADRGGMTSVRLAFELQRRNMLATRR